MTRMYSCPKFNDCNAPLCPLDGELRTKLANKNNKEGLNLKLMIDGETICHFILETMKAGNRRSDVEFIFQAISDNLEIIKAAASKDLEKRLLRASESPSKRISNKPSLAESNDCNTIKSFYTYMLNSHQADLSGVRTV